MSSGKNFILDTSALMAYLNDEKGASAVEKCITTCKIPFICLSELYYLIYKRRGKAEADKIYGVVKSWDLPVLYPDEIVILNAGRIKAAYRLGIADSYVAAFALEDDSQLVTKDQDYEILKEEINILTLDS